MPNPLSRATAFVTLQTDDTDTDALVQYAREHLARYKVPKTSTGKIQKNLLLDRARDLSESS